MLKFFQQILHRADSDENTVLDFKEFTEYTAEEHERNLRRVFLNLDKDQNGWYFLTVFLSSLKWLPNYTKICINCLNRYF